jgi:hypothetical protein
MFTNLLYTPQFCEVAYLNEIFGHLEDLDNYHFIATEVNRHTGEFDLPEWGDHVVAMLVSNEHYKVPQHLDRVHRIWSQYVWKETDKLLALPLGPVYDIPVLPYRPPSERSLDVFFSGQKHHHRQGVSRWRELLEATGLKIEINETGYFRCGLNPQDYAEKLMDAKVALCPGGGGLESFRLFEAMRSGCATISYGLPENRLYVGSPTRQFWEWEELLVYTVRELLANIEEESKNALQWYKDFYEPAAVAQHIRVNL